MRLVIWSRSALSFFPTEFQCSAFRLASRQPLPVVCARPFSSMGCFIRGSWIDHRSRVCFYYDCSELGISANRRHRTSRPVQLSDVFISNPRIGANGYLRTLCLHGPGSRGRDHRSMLAARGRRPAPTAASEGESAFTVIEDQRFRDCERGPSHRPTTSLESS